MICCDLYDALAKEYMANAKSRDKWESYLYGLALTMTRNSSDHVDVLKTLKLQFPTAEEARNKCDVAGGLGLPQAMPEYGATYSTEHILHSVCNNSSLKPIEERVGKKVKTKYPSWGHLKFALETCDREAVRKHYTFQQQKGADMVLLESGCQTEPVMDIWMIRLALNIRGLELPKRVEDLDANLAELRKSKTLKGKDNRLIQSLLDAREEAESFEKWARKDVQGKKKRYKEAKEIIVAQAKECGKQVGDYHVSCWLGQRFPDQVEARAYVKELIGAMEGM